jgi:hypothetical protein
MDDFQILNEFKIERKKKTEMKKKHYWAGPQVGEGVRWVHRTDQVGVYHPPKFLSLARRDKAWAENAYRAALQTYSPCY